MPEAASPLIQHVAVIGAGEQGRAFALRCARAGFQTVLEDVMPARLRRAREEFAAGEDHAQLRFSLTVEEAVREADLAIDFVPDELESKLEVFSLVDRMAPPRTILCPPTHALSISDLAACTYRNERCFALRGEDLGNSRKITLVCGRAGDAEIEGGVRDWLAALGFEVSLAEDDLTLDGFACSRPTGFGV